MRPASARRTALAAALACTVVARGAAAQGDGAHGRLARDAVVSVGVLGGVRLDGGEAAGVVEAAARARYLDAAGIVVAATHAPGIGGTRLFVGVEVRPLFPARFLMNLASGDEWLDLFVDSIGLELGASVGPLAQRGTGVAFAWGVGVELPLVLPSVWPGGGLHLRLAARRTAARRGDLSGPDGGVDDWTVLAGLVVRGAVDLGLTGPDRPAD